MTEPTDREPGSIAPLAPPQPAVVNAVRLMFVGAALSAIGIIVVVTTKSSMRTAIAKKNPSFGAHKLDTTVNAAIAISIVFGIIFLVLYVLLALQIREGKNWARVITMVITAVGLLVTFASFAQSAAAVSHIFGIISGVIDVAIIVLLVQSKQYFPRVVQ